MHLHLNLTMNRSETSVPIQKWNASKRTHLDDKVALEEPLQIVIDGRALAVVMRTPDDDDSLVFGFLFTEGIITAVEHVARIDLESKRNHALVFLADGHVVNWDNLTRHLFSASSCGLCGKATIDAVMQGRAALSSQLKISQEILLQAPQHLLDSQKTFSTTGGLHASGLFNQAGELLVLKEDIGRHNALDKIIGHGLQHGIDFAESFLLLSGRISFELIQKSLAAGIPIVAGISAPSSLAVEFAQEADQTLVGFLRPPSLNIYSAAERIS